MDRAVPRTGSEEIELYIRTYYSLLRSTADVQLRALEESHTAMGSSLHRDARGLAPDMSALIYSTLRLPPCIAETGRVILGQSLEVFQQHGVGDVAAWQPVAAPARRRRSYYDGNGTLACFIGSGTDIDDLIPLLTAYQIEWNKLHRLLRGEQGRAFLDDPVDDDDGLGGPRPPATYLGRPLLGDAARDPHRPEEPSRPSARRVVERLPSRHPALVG